MPAGVTQRGSYRAAAQMETNFGMRMGQGSPRTPGARFIGLALFNRLFLRFRQSFQYEFQHIKEFTPILGRGN